MGKAKTAEEKAKDALAKLAKKATDLGLTLTGSETAEELQAKIDEATPKKADKNSTTFVFKNGGTRTFSEGVHGEDWEALADEFQETNKATIANRDGEAI